jgi:hypothetical protein
MMASGHPDSQNDTNNSIISRPTVQTIISQVRVSEIYREATGVEPKRYSGGRWRARATCNGDGLNVSLDDGKGVWYDFVTREGGGVLALVQRVKDCTKGAALGWLADLVGIQLPKGFHRRFQHRQQRADPQPDLIEARYWRQATFVLCEEALRELSERLFDATAGEVDFDHLQATTSLVHRLRWADDAVLLFTYRAWRLSDPTLTAALVCAGQRHEQRFRSALVIFLDAENGGSDGKN